MGYRCVVCVKQVPDTKRLTGQAMKEDGTVNRAALPAVFNPEDLNALEAALAIRDRHAGTVTVISMGLPKASDVLRESLFRGANRAILITDRRAAGSDTLATSYILSCAIRRLEPDIVLCGRQAIDGDTAQVGPQIAEKLGYTLVTFLEELLDLRGSTLRVRRNLGNGFEVVEARLPVLATVLDTANTPRPPAAKRLMKFKKARCRSEVEQAVSRELSDATEGTRATEVTRRCLALAERGLLIEQWSLDDVGADLVWCGLKGSATKVHRVQSIVLAGGAYREYPPTDGGVARLVRELIEDHTIG
ncbi:MAG TPA: electron transfer flavoprotein subunit beta/FixA family protein [Thermoanaerobaculaceae bacterium]|nr:electron transfer flavoprotein subunit beta/FixA family protein [Thermoanaerobaculaceae bacterium]